MAGPGRGEVWLLDLNPTRGHAQAGLRPCLVVSVNQFNQGPAGLAIVLPITTKAKGIPFHVEIPPFDGGVRQDSFVKCEDIRSVAKERFYKRWGMVSQEIMAEVEDRLRILLSL